MWRLAMGIVLCLLLAVVAAILFVVPLRRGYTPPYRSADAAASLEQVNLGETQQWILIRGSKKDNPLLLFLHGGPGMPTM
jgi:L-proline amide hydrolase